MSLAVRDGNGAGTSLKTSPSGSDHVPHNNVDTLPTAFTTDTSAIKVAVQAIAAIISGGRLAVDLSTTVVTYLANLPTLATYLNTLQGAITAARMQVDLAATPTANLATLAGAITTARMAVNVDSTTTGKLDLLHTDLSPASTIYDGNKNVSTAGTRVALAASQALTRGVRVRAKDANTGLIYVGGSGVTNGSDRLAAAEPIWIDANNLANVYIDAAVSGEGVTFSAW